MKGISADAATLHVPVPSIFLRSYTLGLRARAAPQRRRGSLSSEKKRTFVLGSCRIQAKEK